LVLSLVGSFLVGVICLIQIDLKILIAYSSVVHIGLVIVGLIRFSFIGYRGALLLIFRHGVVSSGLFYLGYLYYTKVGSRNILALKGTLGLEYRIGIFWFLLVIWNIAAPPSGNLIREVFLFVSVFSYSLFFIILILLVSLFGSLYNFYLFGFIHGEIKNWFYSYSLFTLSNFLVILAHLVVVVVIVLNLVFLLFLFSL